MEGAILNHTEKQAQQSPFSDISILSLATHPSHSIDKPSWPQDSLAKSLFAMLDDAKAENIVSLDVSGKTCITDTLLIATGRSVTHVGAIAEKLETTTRQRFGLHPKIEGLPYCDWVVVDCGDVVVHIFRPEIRSLYNLEKIWGNDRPYENKASHN